MPAAREPSVPLPPFELAQRVGAIDAEEDPWAYYERVGARAKEAIVGLLPTGWTWEGRRALDFGSGAGRTVRHFLGEAEQAEVWACDIDERSIAWIDEHLSPPLRALVNGEAPPLDLPAAHLDLVWSVSVFTHLTDRWAAWLLELHRVLKDDGLLVATFMGPAMTEAIAGEPFDEERIGMHVLQPGASWDEGGPMVLHAPWWIRAHWGRAFDVVELRESGFGAPDGSGHGYVLLRKRPGAFTVEDLEAPEPGEPREATSLAHTARTLARESAWLRHELDVTRIELERLATSRSWRATQPLRRLGATVRAHRPR